MAESTSLYLGHHLLDHEIVGAHGEPLGKVEDVELSELEPGETPYVTGLRTGQIAYGERLGGPLGRWIGSIGRRLRGQAGPEPRRVDISLVSEVTHTVVLGVPASDLAPMDLERWLSDHFIGRIPGSGG
jgi:hypothetical protein